MSFVLFRALTDIWVLLCFLLWVYKHLWLFKMYAFWKCKHLVGVCTYVKYFEFADLDNDVLFTSMWKRIENKILKSLYLCVCVCLCTLKCKVLCDKCSSIIHSEVYNSGGTEKLIKHIFWLMVHELEERANSSFHDVFSKVFSYDQDKNHLKIHWKHILFFWLFLKSTVLTSFLPLSLFPHTSPVSPHSF